MPHNNYMFFRRHTPRVVPFRERVESLKQSGFSIEFRVAGSALVTRNGIGAVVEDRPDRPYVNKAGLLINVSGDNMKRICLAVTVVSPVSTLPRLAQVSC